MWNKKKMFLLICLSLVFLVGCSKINKKEKEVTKSTSSSVENLTESQGEINMTMGTGYMLNDSWAIVKLPDRSEHLLFKVKNEEKLPDQGESFTFKIKSLSSGNEGIIELDSWEKTKNPSVLNIPINEGYSFAWQFPNSLIDVRTAEEFAEGYIPEAVNIPLDTIDSNLSQINKNQPVFLYCRSGRRSEAAADFLLNNGYSMVIDLGGILDYTGEMMK